MTSTSDVGTRWLCNDSVTPKELVLSRQPSKPSTFVEARCYGPIPFPKADSAFPTKMVYPTQTLTKWENIALLPNHVLVDIKTNSLLPYSFFRNRLYHHGGLRRVENDLYETKHAKKKLKTVVCDSPLYHADTDHPEVFGHVLLEVLSSLWALDKADRADLKVATSVKLTEGYLSLFKLIGIPEQNLVRIDSVVISREIYLPSKTIQRRREIDPVSREVFDRIKFHVAAGSNIKTPEKIYISRSKVAGRKLLNEVAVEALFKSYGFQIIHPQELKIEEQILLFMNAKFIAGSGGSAMHNTLFSSPDCKVLIVSSTGWLVVADSLICQQKNQLGYVFGSPTDMPEDTHRTQGDWSVSLPEVREAITKHFRL